jgi:hypothetical protein
VGDFDDMDDTFHSPDSQMGTIGRRFRRVFKTPDQVEEAKVKKRAASREWQIKNPERASEHKRNHRLAIKARRNP